MRRIAAVFVMFAFVVTVGSVFAEDKVPAPIVYENKQGAVTFDHATHVEKAKGDCKACHDGLWPKAKGDLGYKAGMHKPAETNKKSCGACHVAGGTAFESKGNCAKCHVKK